MTYSPSASVASFYSLGQVLLTVEMLVVVLLRPQLVLDDEGIGGWEVGHSAREELATWNQICEKIVDL